MKNPIGQCTDAFDNLWRVTRSGSWRYDREGTFMILRGGDEVTWKSITLGFRVFRTK